MKEKKEGFVSIAIDGPSGVGKTTIAKSIAEKLQYLYIDTGAMFRALSVRFQELGLDPADEAAVCAALPDIALTIRYEDGTQHMIVNGEDVTDRLRTEDISRIASVTSQYQKVRSRLLEMQRELARTADVIMDGRDIGTVVLPQATLKVFLTARARVRAERRYKQLVKLDKLEGATLESIEKDIEERDYRDSHREIAPLKPADDAVTIDTSDLTIAEVEAAILDELAKRC
ncbi:MAG: (d)CMP kinase [Lachnospiraceae bacterium]|nr:(d)CMP kinase [Lachnospiraceae bacterium]